MNNVFDQVKREIATRYDFKGTAAQIEWLDASKSGFKITGDGEWQIESIIEITRKKLASRNQSQKILDVSIPPQSANLKDTKNVPFKSGLNQEKAKKITSQLHSKFPKIKSTIQGETVRISSNSKDELQTVITFLRTLDLDFPLNFTNYR